MRSASGRMRQKPIVGRHWTGSVDRRRRVSFLQADIWLPIREPVNQTVLCFKVSWHTTMYELHSNEQYFFDTVTLTHLTGVLSRYDNVCCLCAPMLGKSLVEAGCHATILDVDERFAAVQGFQRWDLFRPQWLTQTFDVIVCDPPFFNASLSQLFAAIRLLSHNSFDQPLLISYLRRRSAAILGTFSPFQLAPTGYRPGYQTVQDCERNEIEFFSNLSDEDVEWLNQG